MATPILSYRTPGQSDPHSIPLPYVDSRFVLWHATSIGIGAACLALPQALGGFGILLLVLLPGVVFLHTVAIGFPLVYQGFRSSGPILLRIPIALLGLVGP